MPAGASSPPSTPCGPTRSSSTISRSAHVSRCRPPASPTPTSCSGTRARCRSRARCTATRRSGRRPSRPDSAELADLRALCDEVSARFTAEWNRTARALDPAAPLTADAFGEHGDLVLYNYPAALAEGDGRTLPPHAFLGSTRRIEAVDDEVEAWMAATPEFAYVSFGSFLSVRGDVLRRVAEALVEIGMPAAIATGSTPPDELGPTPAGLARARVPPAGAAAVAGPARGHARRQQLGHRGRSGRGFPCSCCRSRRISSPERPRSSARASVARSTRTRRRSMSSPQR